MVLKNFPETCNSRLFIEQIIDTDDTNNEPIKSTLLSPQTTVLPTTLLIPPTKISIRPTTIFPSTTILIPSTTILNISTTLSPPTIILNTTTTVLNIPTTLANSSITILNPQTSVLFPLKTIIISPTTIVSLSTILNQSTTMLITATIISNIALSSAKETKKEIASSSPLTTYMMTSISTINSPNQSILEKEPLNTIFLSLDEDIIKGKLNKTKEEIEKCLDDFMKSIEIGKNMKFAEMIIIYQ